MLVVGVGGLWGRMGGRLRVGWEVGLVLAYEDGQQKKKKDLLSFNMIPHQSFPFPFFSLCLSVTLAMSIRFPKSKQDADQLFPGVQSHIAQILYRCLGGYTPCYLYRRVWQEGCPWGMYLGV